MVNNTYNLSINIKKNIEISGTDHHTSVYLKLVKLLRIYFTDKIQTVSGLKFALYWSFENKKMQQVGSAYL